jgi:glutaconate CoA-transferase subunit B
VQAATAWPIRFAAHVRQTPPPAPEEMENLRDLERRTAIAHQRSVSPASSGPSRMD